MVLDVADRSKSFFDFDMVCILSGGDVLYGERVYDFDGGWDWDVFYVMVDILGWVGFFCMGLVILLKGLKV